jgi:hypothetical protein
MCGAGTRRPSVSPPNYHLQHPRSFADREQGPAPPKRAGAHTTFEICHSGRRAQSPAAGHKVTRLNHSKDLAALLCNFLAPWPALPKSCLWRFHTIWSGSRPGRMYWGSRAPNRSSVDDSKQVSLRVHFERFQWFAARLASRFFLVEPSSLTAIKKRLVESISET